jgi:late competence protein required for DNA uptake (superfamily II DNA/RNA helicase)
MTLSCDKGKLMPRKFDASTFREFASLKNRYERQLQRLRGDGLTTDCIEVAVKGAIKNLSAAKRASLVIYGDPQSGKTEMMICLTAKLLDAGTRTIVHLMNDSVDLLNQNLQRFKSSGLAPAALSSSELFAVASKSSPTELVVLCKKNAKDLDNLKSYLDKRTEIIVIDDEADYATPNAKVNKGAKTKINELIEQIIGRTGSYIGVTATPARLDLNNTFQNETEKWVHFPPHSKYTGQDTFFPLSFAVDRQVPYRLEFLTDGDQRPQARAALIRFLVSVAYMNKHQNAQEKNYSMLVHTSGKKDDHETDRLLFQGLVESLVDNKRETFDRICEEVYTIAARLFEDADPNSLTQYVIENASRASLVVLNSERDRVALGTNAAIPSSPFTIIIGGNIVSRGVTFPNLLSMFFTRSVQSKLQQDTYIQRARMFGARSSYLKYFELTIPAQLYLDWHKCFVFHRRYGLRIAGYPLQPARAWIDQRWCWIKEKCLSECSLSVSQSTAYSEPIKHRSRH